MIIYFLQSSKPQAKVSRGKEEDQKEGSGAEGKAGRVENREQIAQGQARKEGSSRDGNEECNQAK
jgi:hypothetical protein